MARNFIHAAVALCVLFVATASAQQGADASSIRTARCAEFTASGGDGRFEAYLAGYGDASAPAPGYVLSPVAIAGQLRAARDWCAARPQALFSEAVIASIPPRGMADAPPPPLAAPIATPTSCRVGDTRSCGGCSVTCPPGKQARCNPGTDNMSGDRCVFKASCDCR